MRRPRIGVTTSSRSGWRIFPLIAFSVWMAGGAARWFHVGQGERRGDVDGWIVGGGDDISAGLYGGDLTLESRVDPERDELERQIVTTAVLDGKPVLGICRGSQMVNVALGGTLHQDIYARYEGAKRYWTVLPRKTVEILEDSRLAAIMGARATVVNALHTQSVDCLGSGVRVAARDEHGIVQAIEVPDQSFMLGVQWHPEHLFYARRQRALFRALVDAARAELHPSLDRRDG